MTTQHVVPERTRGRGVAGLIMALLLAPLVLLLAPPAQAVGTLCLPSPTTACIAGTLRSDEGIVPGIDLSITSADGVEQVVKRMVLWDGRDQSDHALVAMATGQFGQTFIVRLDHAHARVTGFVDELPHAGVAARDLVMDFNNGLGGDLETNAHGMEAEQHFVG